MCSLSNAKQKIFQAIKKKIKKTPDKRPLIDEVINNLEKDLPTSYPLFYVIKAPTGYGKTTITQILGLFALYDKTYFEKVIHVLPMRTIIESAAKNTDEIFEHAIAQKISKKKMMGSSETIFYLNPISFVTIDTFIYDIIKLNTKKLDRIRKRLEFGHDYFTQASILNSLVIFDEVHMLLFDDKIKNVFATILKFLFMNRVPILIMTATISKKQISRLMKFFEGIVGEIKGFRVFEPNQNDPYIQNESKKRYTVNYYNNTQNILELIDKEKRNLIVRNTVSSAVSLYKKICSDPRFKEIDKLLLHSRFTLADRNKKIKELDEITSKDRFIIVSTQVVEAGVDISSDVLITDLAPPNSLIQRMGRVARRPNESEGTIHIIDYTDPYPYPIEYIDSIRKILQMKTSSSDQLSKEVGSNPISQVNNVKKNTSLSPRIPETYDDLINAVRPKFFDSDALLLNKILSPLERSIQVLEFIERKNDQFLRDYMVNAKIEKTNEIITVSLSLLSKLLEKQKIKLNPKFKHIEAKINSKQYYAAAKLIARESINNKNFEIIIDKSAYDDTYGLQVG